MKEITRISIRLPTGDRIVRKFASSTGLEELYAFVECHELLQSGDSTTQASKPEGYDHHYKFNLVSPMPRTVYDLESGGLLGERIGRSGNLIVEPVLNDDDED